MKIYETENYEEMSRKAANILSAQVILKPDCVLGLATGSTPIGTYDKLVEWYEKGDLDFSEVKTVNLDEYRGLTRDNDQSYYYFMHEHLFDRVNIDPENTSNQWEALIFSFSVWDTTDISDLTSRTALLHRQHTVLI